MSLFRRKSKRAGDIPRPSPTRRSYDARSMNEYLEDVPVHQQPIAIIHWLIDDD